MSSETESLQLRLSLLETKHEGETQKHDSELQKRDTEIQKLKQLLQRFRRKAVNPTVTEGTPPIPIPSTQVAPTAAVKPTVTTTPTASIRPMAVQTTTAPTAHVTPTMVTTQHITPPTSQLANQIGTVAAVFVRSTSPQIVTPLPTVTVSSSVAVSVTMATPSIPVASPSVSMASQPPEGDRASKRRREDDTLEIARFVVIM